ncbi:MAG TPA: cardiolipin synthase [Anaerolineales bacterium]|nr:cardiolipin synthase [Anaerolineales bacterium]
MDISSITLTLQQILGVVYVIYVCIVGGIILLDNRSPQSTFAWLFLMLSFPILGFLVYVFFGRGYKAFSRENKLARLGGLSTLYGTVIQPLRDIQDEYAEIVRREEPESYRQKLLSLVKRNSPSILTIYNQVEILQDVTEKYPSLLEDVRNAKSSIHLLYYIWSEDEFTVQLKDALIERAKAGVKVHALADASCLNVSKQYLEDLRKAGVQLLPYKVFKQIGRLHTANYRSHRKIVVIDGKIGYIGGMNLDKEQLPGGNPLGSWRDTHLRIVGEGALALQASFAVSWYNTTKEIFDAETYFPKVDTSQLPVTPLQLTLGGPDSQWKAMQQLYFFMIMTAEKKVQIQSPFFVPDESLLEAIKAAALSGVQVQIMVSKHGTAVELAHRASFTYLAEVVRSGAKVYLYDKGYFHSKTINVDSQVCAIGTANFDIRSFSINYEAMAVLYDKEMADELAADFENDLKSCEEFSLAAYKASPLWRRLLNSTARLASPLL